MRTYLNVFVLLFLLVGLSGCISGGENVAQAPTLGSGGVKPVTDDLIRVGDSLAVRVSGVPANDQGIYEVQVDEAGSISMPYIGNVQASGLTSVALKQKIEQAYKSAGIFPSSNIQIFTKEVRFVNIDGEVRSPQRLAYTRDLTLRGAISACGGFSEYANKRKVIILRNGKPMQANALEIIKNPALDVPLYPGDSVQVNRSIL